MDDPQPGPTEVAPVVEITRQVPKEKPVESPVEQPKAKENKVDEPPKEEPKKKKKKKNKNKGSEVVEPPTEAPAQVWQPKKLNKMPFHKPNDIVAERIENSQVLIHDVQELDKVEEKLKEEQ